MAAAAYNGFIYGVVYLFNESFPLVFGSEEGHGFNTGQTGLTFLGIAIGALIAACFYPLQERYYLRRVAENNGKGVPEARMGQARFGAFLLPISLFWFAWTSYRSIHWIVLRRWYLHRHSWCAELRCRQLPGLLGECSRWCDPCAQRRGMHFPSICCKSPTLSSFDDS